MKLYYMPGACSIGIHVLLEEIGKPYDLQKIDGAKQEQYGPDFVKLNPKSKVPTLAEGRRLGADRVPGDRHLARPQEPRQEPAAVRPGRRGQGAGGDGLRRLDHAHAGLQPHVPPGQLSPRPRPTTTRSRRAARRSWRRASPSWTRRSRARNTSPASISVADAALFYVTFWAAGRMKMPLPKNCRRPLRADEEPAGGEAHRRAGRPDGRRLTFLVAARLADGVCGAARRERLH